MSDMQINSSTPHLTTDVDASGDIIMNYLSQKSTQLLNKPSIIDNSCIKGCIFHPKKGFIPIWNAFMGLLLFYTAIAYPFIIAFYDSDYWVSIFIIDTIIDCCFTLDLVFNLNTGFYNSEKELILFRGQILLHYLKSWPIFHFISSLPYGLFEACYPPTSSTATNLVRISRLRNIPKLLRLSRLTKLARNLTFIQEFDYVLTMDQRVLKLLKTILGILISLHIISCIWYFSARIYSFDPSTWVVRYGYLDQPIWICYETAVYWALTTLITVGYGDIVPHNPGEKAIVMLWMLFTIYFFSVTIGTLTNIFSELDSRDKLINQKLLLADEFAKSTKIPLEIINKLKRTIRLCSRCESFTQWDKDFLFHRVPTKLKLTIAKSMFRGSVMKFHFFADRDENFVASTALYLESKILEAGEIVWKAGEPCKWIGFILNGKVNYTFGQEKRVFRCFTEGHHFGDIELVNHEVRRFEAVSAAFGKCMVLPKASVLRITEEFPAVWRDIVRTTKEREKKLYRDLAEMKVLHQENKIRGMGAVDKAELNIRIKKEFKYIMMENKSKKKTKREIMIERVGEGIQRNIDILEGLEIRIGGITKRRSSIK